MKKISALAILALGIGLGTIQAHAECYSEGVRVGVVQKFSLKGYVNKSWEGEMVQDGERVKAKGQGAGVTNIWKFSVLDPAVAKKLDDAVFSGAQVAVRYCQQRGLALLGKADTEYVVSDVRARQ
jgi:hypothetical protein